MTRTRRAIAVGVVSLLVLGVACSSAEEPDLSAPDDAAARSDETASDDTASGGTSADGSDDGEALGDETYYVAEALDDELVVRDSANPQGLQIATLTTTDAVSGRLVARVVQEVGGWVQVDLPATAEVARGWVSRDDVAVSRHRYRIEIALAERTLTLYSGSVVALTTPVALGPDAPTTGQDLFITELVQPPDPAGPYGAYAYGLSASVNDVAAFQSGQGVVAVHGLADPNLAGSDLPTGSIGVTADIMSRLTETVGLPLGTTVEIVA